MQKNVRYTDVFFTPEVLDVAWQKLVSLIPPDDKKARGTSTFTVGNEGEAWRFDNFEEFASECRKIPQTYTFIRSSDPQYCVVVDWYRANRYSQVSVTAPDRASIEKVFLVFEGAKATSMLPPEPPDHRGSPEPEPVVFIGHGHSTQWRDLKDHLQDKHGIKIEAYETGSRAGHAVRDILEGLMARTSFALLVLTAEDEMADGGKRARQNVIHETGLFQGRLGFNRAIVLLEKGADEFSNIYGIEQLRFSKDNIKETFGDVLAVLKREFPNLL